MLEAATTLLRRTFGHREFRPLQERVIAPAMAGRDVLAVLPTGGGKSLCFQVPALHGEGLTVVVSPLIALMQDQVARLKRVGASAEMLGGDIDRNVEAATLARAESGELRLLYLSPERLPRMVDELARRGVAVNRLAVDEAHCIVEWGHDFRPSYRKIRQARVHLGRPQCIALTASATPDVRAAIKESLGMSRDAVEVVGSFDRSNLHLQVVRANGPEDRLSRMIVLVRTTRGPVVVYAPTRGLTEGLASALVDCGVAAAPYHAGMAPAERRATLDGFLSDRHRVVVATCAFGMGIDKPDVRLVAHWTLPSTPESYYQEAGRAGRDGLPARCVLFHHPSDERHPRRQLATTFPQEKIVEAIWRDPALRPRHPVHVVAAADRLEQELRPAHGRVDWSGVRRRRRAAEHRLGAMIRYAQTRGCRRAALIGWFGETVRSCGNCDNCRGRPG